MSKLVLAAALIALSTRAAIAADPWTKGELALGAAAAAAFAVDWAQTRQIARARTSFYTTPACADPATRRFAEPCELVSVPTYSERNPFLPTYPSDAEVNRYFIVSGAAIAVAAYMLPHTWRRALLGGALAVELYYVAGNRERGLAVALPF